MARQTEKDQKFQPVDFNRVRAALEENVGRLVDRTEMGLLSYTDKENKILIGAVQALSTYLLVRTQLIPHAPPSPHPAIRVDRGDQVTRVDCGRPHPSERPIDSEDQGDVTEDCKGCIYMTSRRHKDGTGFNEAYCGHYALEPGQGAIGVSADGITVRTPTWCPKKAGR
jgi:hypothetical protein